MINLKRIGLPLALAALAGVAIGAAFQAGGPAAPATPQVVGQNGGPAWRDSQDIGNGVEMETTVAFCENVTVPGSGATVRPLAIHINFLHGVGLLTQVNYVQLHPLADTTPLVFNIAGLDRNIVVAQRPPFGPLDYLVTLTPKTGYTWGTIQGAIHMDILAIEQ